MSVLETITIDGKTHELPSGASALVNGDNLIIQNRAGGRDMKHKKGTFVSAPDENGRVTVEVGFKPDFLKVTLPFSNGDTYAVYDSVMFKDKTYWWIPMENSTRYYTIPDLGNGETGIVEITDTGFVFRSHAENTRNVTCTYEAIMFIPVEGGGSKHSYSTEEQVVGTWIDGKPIYERSYKTKSVENTNEAIPFIDVSDLDIDAIISIEGYIHGIVDVGYQNVRLNWFYNTSIYTSTWFQKMDSGEAYLFQSISNLTSEYTNKDAYATIQYTKTTD